MIALSKYSRDVTTMEGEELIKSKENVGTRIIYIETGNEKASNHQRDEGLEQHLNMSIGGANNLISFKNEHDMFMRGLYDGVVCHNGGWTI